MKISHFTSTVAHPVPVAKKYNFVGLSNSGKINRLAYWAFKVSETKIMMDTKWHLINEE